MAHSKRPILILFVCMLLVASLFGYKFFQIRQAEKQHRPPPPAVVAATIAKQENWRTGLRGIGNLEAAAGVSVSNEIAGQVTAIYFKSGQTVKKEQALVDLNYETEQAELAGLQARLRLAQIQLERSRKLIAGQFTSKSDYDQNLALLNEAKAAVLAKQRIIRKKQIHAPFSGIIGIRQVNVGQYLSPGTDIATLQQLAPLYVDFALSEKYFGFLKHGQRVKITSQAYPQTVFEGYISALSPLIDQSSRSVKIRATLPNKDHTLRPGMFTEVQVLLDQQRGVITLPDTAISYNPYGDFVYVIQSDKDGLFVQNRLIKTGVKQNDRVEVVSGLKPGERVVSAGQIKLRNGMRVTIAEHAAPGERLEQVTP